MLDRINNKSSDFTPFKCTQMDLDEGFVQINYANEQSITTNVEDEGLGEMSPVKDSSDYIPTSYKVYDLTHIIGRELTLNREDPELPEYKLYHSEPQVEDNMHPYLKTSLDYCQPIFKDLKYVAKTIVTLARHCLYESNFELLLTLPDNPDRIRATKGSLFGTGLYSLSNFAPKKWFFNFFKQTCMEGVITGYWSHGNAVKIAERVPGILLEKCQTIFSQFDQNIASEIRKSAAILTDDQYSDVTFLDAHIKTLENLFYDYKTEALQVELSAKGSGKTAMRKVADAIDNLLEKHFSSVSILSSHHYYRVDELKIYLEETFSRIDHFSEKVRGSFEKIIKNRSSSTDVTTNKVEMQRERVYKLTEELCKLTQENLTQLNELRNFVTDFETRRGL
ncbi:MAG: hypothetical protein S4CHLAM7_12320 [Chlamydiae bacterium]|nr:hypothetical protein [Chlamydiota bacterium]